MERKEIDQVLSLLEQTKQRNIVIVDYGNVQKWENSLNWPIGIKELGVLVRRISGREFLRRFYYGSDYGRNEKSDILVNWSRMVLEKAQMSGFEVQTKRVKYIHDSLHEMGFQKKCDLDVEMTVDLIREAHNYDRIVLFSGDGDLSYALKYLFETQKKKAVIFTARGHLGRELIDIQKEGIVESILFAEDFEYRINRDRFRY
jgi:uncharacterized LabA/DUF88 family protein